MSFAWKLFYGATPLGDGRARFHVWAPHPKAMCVKVDGRLIPMSRQGEDFGVVVDDARPGVDYTFVLDGGRELPDPVSRWQPHGVHGASRMVDPDAFQWTDQDWKGIALCDYIFYEIHAGTFTPEGTFEGIISKLPHLKELGITAVELMPIAEFPGHRNWGYDGVDLYAPHSAYGGPEGLKNLVNACHREGLAVVMDVVYNHIGPEGNYLSEFGRYFTHHYRTPWGQALNFDSEGCDGVRQFFIDNALYWLTEYHVDALRLDAIHSILDLSAFHVLAELGERFHEQAEHLGRQAFIIAESDLNDVRVIQPRRHGGHALDAQWMDDFHHSLLTVLTGATHGFLNDYGQLQQLGKAITEGFVYDGIYAPHRKRRFGSSSKELPGEKFTVFIQNHDQVANTSEGQRLAQRVGFEAAKLAAALVQCAPDLPLLFMGEEFAETAPFLYFTSHGDQELATAVTEGRRREFADFASLDKFWDPQDPDTFETSKVSWQLVDCPHHREMLQLYRDLIALRKSFPALGNCRKDLTTVETDEQARWLKMTRRDPDGSGAVLVCNFAQTALPFEPPAGSRCALNTAAKEYGGPGGKKLDSIHGCSAALFILQ